MLGVRSAVSADADADTDRLTTLTSPSGQILDAHLLLEVLLQTRLVGKLPVAVGALEGAVEPAMRRLDVVVEEPLLGKVLAAVDADKGAFPRVHPVVDVQVGLARVGLGADGADEGLLAGVHPDVLHQAVKKSQASNSMAQ